MRIEPQDMFYETTPWAELIPINDFARKTFDAPIIVKGAEFKCCFIVAGHYASFTIRDCPETGNSISEICDNS